MTLGPLFGSAGVCMPGQSSVDADPAPAAARRTQVASKLEIFLLYLFGVGVAGSGIGGFFGHFFISDSVAESIGWPTSNPFQLEVGFANLAIGILGIVAMGRRDGFREATVIAVTVFGVGATIVHVMDVIESGNLAPGNTVQKRQQSSQARIVDRFPGCQQTSGAFA